jgi:hypothetical protein
MERLRRKLRIDLVLAGVGALLAALTAVFPPWIEALSGADPDGGSGEWEWAVSGLFLLVAVVFAVRARRTYRLITQSG